MLTFAALSLEMLPSWLAALPDNKEPVGAGRELSETEGLIVEALARSLSELDDTIQAEMLLSSSDPAIVAAFVRRVVLWRRVLSCASSELLWPIEAKDVWVHIVRQLPPKLPVEIPRVIPPRIEL